MQNQPGVRQDLQTTLIFWENALTSKLLPKGFKLKFHSPIKTTILQRHLTSFANKLIRSSINHFRYQQTKFSEELPSLTCRLKFLCHTRDSYFDIRQKIHEFNQTLYNFLKAMKDKKLKELINDQKQDPIDANQAISTLINNITHLISNQITIMIPFLFLIQESNDMSKPFLMIFP